jgi:hypothetical protein
MLSPRSGIPGVRMIPKWLAGRRISFQLVIKGNGLRSDNLEESQARMPVPPWKNHLPTQIPKRVGDAASCGAWAFQAPEFAVF